MNDKMPTKTRKPDAIGASRCRTLFFRFKISLSASRALTFDDVSLSVMPSTVQVVIVADGTEPLRVIDAIIGRVRPMSGRVIFKGADITELPRI